MNEITSRKKEFGDFQTPEYLSDEVCNKLKQLGIDASTIIEPTCGVGNFVISAVKHFPGKRVLGFEINKDYINVLDARLKQLNASNVEITQSDFFSTVWKGIFSGTEEAILVLGNLPWVTNSTQGSLESENLPNKNNFQNHKGLDAITGKANFDISEWMLLENMSWFEKRPGAIAMLVKTAVARKAIAHAEKIKAPLWNARIFKINAKAAFDAAVDACLLLLEFDAKQPAHYDYSIYEGLNSNVHTRIGHRNGMTIANLENYERYAYLIGESSVKWRSGVKHDLSAIMEFTREGDCLVNGLGARAELEPDLLYPLMKGSDVGADKPWRNKFVLVTQSCVGQNTVFIRDKYPKTWEYLLKHAQQLDSRASVIYKKNPRFSVFGVGDYSFKPWKIAICGLYKLLNFKMVGPIENKAAIFDDTVYFISFDSEDEARAALAYLQKTEVKALFNSLIFWDDKRPVKTGILNILKWNAGATQQNLLFSS